MIETWKSFLESQGAVIDGDRIQHFGAATAERRAAAKADVLAALADVSLIRARGPDTRDFLNAQLSNDVRELDATRSQLTSWCSPKGRMLVIFRMFRRGEDTLLVLPAALRESIYQRLKMFVLRAKVTLDIADAELVCLGLSGPKAQGLLAQAVGFAPDEIDGSATRDSITAIRIAGPHPRYLIVAPPDAAMKLWQAWKGKAVPVGSSVWGWLDIMAGIPSVHPATSEAFVPQMANLELVGGVNFKKGCYPGQEIVARMQYLGKLKQRMYLGHTDGPTTPKPGDAIFSPDFPGQSAGTVVAVEPAPEQGFDLLAVIQISSAVAGKLHHGSENGTPVQLQSLPYPVK